MSVLLNLLRRFARDEKGTLIVDVVLVLPIMIWGYAGLFAYWDAYRSINTVQKAAYTISDLLSRTQTNVNSAYIDGLRTTMNVMLDSDQAGDIRVTSFRWSEPNDRYEVIFSQSPESAMTALDNGDLANITEYLPTMSDGDSATLVEVKIPYTPPMGFGLEPTTINQFIVTRPRFLPKICHDDYEC